MPERRYFERSGSEIDYHVHMVVFESKFWREHIFLGTTCAKTQRPQNSTPISKKSLPESSETTEKPIQMARPSSSRDTKTAGRLILPQYGQSIREQSGMQRALPFQNHNGDCFAFWSQNGSVLLFISGMLTTVQMCQAPGRSHQGQAESLSRLLVSSVVSLQ